MTGGSSDYPGVEDSVLCSDPIETLDSLVFLMVRSIQRGVPVVSVSD